MTGSRRVALATLCVTEVISWGVLYYTFPVALSAISADTGWSQTTTTGAFSGGLVVSALMGVPVGRWLDRYGPRRVMTAGSALAVPATLAIAAAPTLLWFGLAWVLAGVAMSGVLYPPAFAALTRWFGDRRAGALTVLTMAAGLTSTIFAPLTSSLLDHLSWRTIYALFAIVLGLITIPAHALLLRVPWSTGQREGRARTTEGDSRAAEGDSRAAMGNAGAADRNRSAPEAGRYGEQGDHVSAESDHVPAESDHHVPAVLRGRRFLTLTTGMTISVLTMFATSLTLIPLLVGRGLSHSAAALAFGLVGAGQLLGRVAYPPLTRLLTPRARTTSIGIGATATIASLAILPGPPALLVTIAILLGAVRGAATLVQATAVADRWGTRRYGTLSGVFTAPLTAAAAIAPFAGTAVASLVGSYPWMFAVFAVLVMGASLLSATEPAE